MEVKTAGRLTRDEVLATDLAVVANRMLDSATFLLYQCDDPWWHEKVRLHAAADADELWRKFFAWREHVQRRCFTCGYQGAIDYTIDTVLYTVRYSGDPRSAWNTGVYDGEIAPLVGTVRYYSGCGEKGFPPPKVIAAFPGIVPVRATFRWEDGHVKDWTWVFDETYGRPESWTDKFGNLRSRGGDDYNRVDDWEKEPLRKRLFGSS